MTTEELAEVLRLHKLWIDEEPGGVRAVLTEAILVGADLSHANLSRAKLVGANLSRANLTYAKLDHTNLRLANLRRADLTNATLVNSDLPYANLSGAILVNANLDYTDLADSNLTSADLSRASLHRSCMNRANLTSAILADTKLVDTSLKDTGYHTLHLVGLRGYVVPKRVQIGQIVFSLGEIRELIGYKGDLVFYAKCKHEEAMVNVWRVLYQYIRGSIIMSMTRAPDRWKEGGNELD